MNELVWAYNLSFETLVQLFEKEAADFAERSQDTYIVFYAEFDTGAEYHDEDTLSKVYEVLDEVQLISTTAEDIVTMLLNKGILFRERTPANA
jgi:hypothetical protein